MKMSSLIPLLMLIAVALACRTMDAGPADKALFVRAADLSDVGVSVQDAEKFETFKKVKYLDGSLEIDYEFEPPESEGVYLTQIVRVEKGNASFGRTAEDKVIGITLNAFGLEKEELVDFYKYGDSSNFYVLKKDGRSVGNYFTAIEGRKVFTFMIAGVYFDDVENWRGIIEPKLRLFSAYKPE